MNRLKNNQKILEILNKFFTDNPDLRFLQGLIALKLIPDSSLFEEESAETLNRIELPPDVITLTSRYGDEYTLIPENEHLYYFDFGKWGEYIRIGLREGYDWSDNEFSFIDPPGGPFISVGEQIDDKIVTRIFSKNNKYYLYLSNKQ